MGKKMYNNIADLLAEMVQCFEQRTMFQRLDERDIISILPIEDSAIAEELLTQTNRLLADLFDIHDEPCYPKDSVTANEENPIFFWKDYLECFYDLELIEDDAVHEKYIGTAFGIYQVSNILYIDEVNKRFRRRKLNGLRLDYQVKATPLDRHHHWNRTYDKNF